MREKQFHQLGRRIGPGDHDRVAGGTGTVALLRQRLLPVDLEIRARSTRHDFPRAVRTDQIVRGECHATGPALERDPVLALAVDLAEHQVRRLGRWLVLRHERQAPIVGKPGGHHLVGSQPHHAIA